MCHSGLAGFVAGALGEGGQQAQADERENPQTQEPTENCEKDFGGGHNRCPPWLRYLSNILRRRRNQ